MKRTLIMLVALVFGATAITASAATTTDDLPGLAPQPASYFYTGKPYDADLGAYTFAYRNYDPELNRWTTPDPSGFPDGANVFQYVNNRVSSFYDDTGLTGKGVLWVTIGNLFGNGQNFAGETGNGSTVNYYDDFINQYSATRSEMQTWDNNHTQAEGWYLRDGDLFDKHIVTSNDVLLNIADGYDRVFYISHGDVDASGNFSMMAPDGTWQSTSFFSGLMGGTNVVLGTCYNGFSSGGNTWGLTGSLTTITWGDALSHAIVQTRDYLWE